MTAVPRGIRNNNPGNIERNATRWQGMSVDQSGDARFVVFDSPVWGIRALARVLLNYYRKHGLRTVAALIGRWAPPGENDTGAYAAQVAKALGVKAEAVVDVADPAVMATIVTAIIAHENGQQPYPVRLLRQAVDLALA